MTNYFNKNELPIGDAKPLPANWRNISGLNKMSDAELKSINFVPEVRVGDKADVLDTEILDGPVNVVGEDEGVATWTVRPKTQAELDIEEARKDAAKDGEVDGFVKSIAGKLSFIQENRILAVEGESQISIDQFKVTVRARL